MTIRSCLKCGGIVADHLESYAGTPCTCAAPAAVPEDVETLCEKLRSRAWEDRQHRLLRGWAADMLESLARQLTKARERDKTQCDLGYMTNGLTFNTLRGANMVRLPEFRNKHGVLAHSKSDGSDWIPAQWLQAVVGELGEYANLRKKHERGDVGADEFAILAADELADVVIYLDLLAFRLGIDLGNAVMEKFNRKSQQVGSRVRLEAGDWHYIDAALAEAKESHD